MNVALVVWPIGQEGGISTRALESQRVLRAAGHDATIYRIAYTDRTRKHDGLAIGGDGFKVGGTPLSITNAGLPYTIRTLNEHDRIQFLHPCPHRSDTQRAVANWRTVYTDTTAPKSTVFTDVYSEDFYPWIADVDGTYRAFGVNSAALKFARRHDRHARLFHAPMPPPARYDGDRNGTLIWNHAWRSWKGVRLVVDAAPGIAAPVVMAGVGRERGAAEKAGLLGCVDAIGQVSPDEMRKRVAEAAVAIDLTGASPKYFGHYNRSTIEPMLLGTPVIVRPSLVAPHSPIPPEAALVWNPQIPLADAVNFFLSRPQMREAAADAAYEWATSFFTDEAAVADLIR